MMYNKQGKDDINASRQSLFIPKSATIHSKEDGNRYMQ